MPFCASASCSCCGNGHSRFAKAKCKTGTSAAEAASFSRGLCRGQSHDLQRLSNYEPQCKQPARRRRYEVESNVKDARLKAAATNSTATAGGPTLRASLTLLSTS